MDNSDHMTVLSGLVNAFLPYKNEAERLALVVNLNKAFERVPPDLLERAVANLREKEDRLPTEKRIREEVKAVAGAAMNPYAWPALVEELERLKRSVCGVPLEGRNPDPSKTEKLASERAWLDVESCLDPQPWFDLARRMEAAGMVYSAAEVRARGNWLIDLGGQHA
jgi:hypothetical protein